MKRYISILMVSVLFVLGLSGCGGKAPSEQTGDSDKIQIVTTIFPEYDWVREIIRGRESEFEVTLLLDNGVDLHSYQPSAEDMLKIASCDMFVYVGGESDQWVEQALESSGNPKRKVLSLMEILGDSVKEEEMVEGMEVHEEEEEEEDGPEEEYDEHVWLSLRNAQAICKAMTETICDLDEENAEIYRENEEVYVEKLSQLDEEYKKAVAEGSKDTLLFADRFPFRYLTDDYGLRYYAAFVGCSAETEASFETIAFLSKKVDDLGLGCVLAIEKSDQKIAQTVVQSTSEKNQEILVLDSIQSVSDQEIAGGVTYLSAMEKNLEILRKALS